MTLGTRAKVRKTIQLTVGQGQGKNLRNRDNPQLSSYISKINVQRLNDGWCEYSIILRSCLKYSLDPPEKVYMEVPMNSFVAGPCSDTIWQEMTILVDFAYNHGIIVNKDCRLAIPSVAIPYGKLLAVKSIREPNTSI